jgi:NADPH-dependent curcumin reductase CurA
MVTNGVGFHKVNPNIAPLPMYTGTLGMTGMTAYFGILEVGELKEGDTVLVSGAAGAVGSVVGQVAKIKNCKVVGIAGGKEKCDYLINELGFDAAIDYKNDDVNAKIKTYFPKGIDVYFDNIGGDLLDAALGRLAMHARIVICGAISQYNNTTAVKGPSNYLSLLVSRATMKGMVVFDHAKDYGKAAQQMGQWMLEGKLKSKEDIYEGIENFHDTFLKLFSGEKMGKLVLKVSE